MAQITVVHRKKNLPENTSQTTNQKAISNHKKIIGNQKNMLKKIIINQTNYTNTYRLVIDYQAKINERNHKENIINKSDIVFTDENGNYVQ